MKKIFGSLLSMCLAICALANNGVESPAKLKPSFLDQCCATVTASATETGVDCNGNPVSITATSTQTSCADDCMTAYRTANRHAQTMARATAVIAISTIGSDCPPPPGN